MTANNGRPLPWHDTARCEAPDSDGGVCGGPMVPVAEMPNGYGGPRRSRIACAACGAARVGSAEDVAKTERASRAFRMLDAGLIHTGRGCDRCNAPLPLDRLRLCSGCVSKDNAERQASLFTL
jgi:hypothetical protein